MGSSATKQKIAEAKAYLYASKLHDGEKDTLGDQLSAVDEAIDKDGSVICDLIAQRTIADVRQAIRLPITVNEIVKAQVEAHARTCPAFAMPAGKVGIFLQCIKSWPLGLAVSVALVAPNAPDIIKTIANLFK